MEILKLLNRYNQLQMEREVLEFELITSIIKFPIRIEDIGLLRPKVLDLLSQPSFEVSYIIIKPIENECKFKVIYNSQEEVINVDIFKDILSIYIDYLDEYVKELKEKK